MFSVQQDSSASDLSSDSSGPTSSYANRHNVHSFTTQSSLVRDREGLTPHDPQMRPRSIAVMGPIHESLSEPINLSSTRDRLYNMRLLADSLESTTGRSEVSCLDEALHNLRTTLEDYQGQYVELARLEEQVHALDFLIKVRIKTEMCSFLIALNFAMLQNRNTVPSRHKTLNQCLFNVGPTL